MNMIKDMGSLDKQVEEGVFGGALFADGSALPDTGGKVMDLTLTNAGAMLSGWTYDDAMRYIVSHSTEAFWQTDAELKFTYTNAACEKISGGYCERELIGKSLLEFLTPEGIDQLHMSSQIRLKEEKKGKKIESSFYELQMRRKDGTYMWVGISACPLRDAHGKISGYQGIIRDVTCFKQYQVEQVRLEKLLKKIEKMASVGMMAGSIAHELNNIMAGILGFSELLMLQINPNDDASHMHLRNIIDASERVTSVLQDVLMLSRREKDVRKSINLNDLISVCLDKPALQDLRNKLWGLSVKLDLERSLHEVMASVMKLEKALSNLLYISFQQAKEAGVVSISTKTLYLGCPMESGEKISEGEYVVISLSNTGETISEDQVAHIFEPFYVKKALKHGVTGLELTTAREVMKDHDGFIDVRNSAGGGVTYTVYFPITQGKSAVPYAMMSSDYLDVPTTIN